MERSLLYNTSLASVRFSMGGTERVKNNSVVQITTDSLLSAGKPQEGGPYDLHLGTTTYDARCQTCYNSKRSCLGHEGSINLSYPVPSPMAHGEIKKWLKLICFECGKAIVESTVYSHLPRMRRLDEASKIARTRGKNCHACGMSHPIVKKDEKEPLIMTAEIQEDKRQVSKETLWPHRIAEIFNRVSDETVRALGKSPDSHPKNFILNSITVPPTTIRPDVKKQGQAKSSNDDLTTMIGLLVKTSLALSNIVPTELNEKQQKSIIDLVNTYHDFIRGSSDTGTSIAFRLKGKKGQFRNKILGKRVHKVCRTTIVGDSRIRPWELGVPMVFAKTIQPQETVQDYNRDRCMSYVQNGRNKYPGCSGVLKKSTGITYGAERLDDIVIENGDIIFRDTIDGDPGNFNRQPSMCQRNIGMHRQIVTRDPTIKAFRMNVCMVKQYDGDFDGDAMNLILSTKTAAINEIINLSDVGNWFVSHGTSSPGLGQTNDSVIGCFEMTRAGVVYDKYHAMMLFQNSDFLPDLSDMGPADIMTGMDAISHVLASTPINYARKANFYFPDRVAYIPYNPAEIFTRISHGKMTSGVLDKTAIGIGVPGSIYHIIHNEYGSRKAMESIYNMQQMSISHMNMIGYTIGPMDIMIPRATKEEIARIATDIISKSKYIASKLENSEIIPPIGMTVEDFYEQTQINTLSVADEFIEPILRVIDTEHNNIYKMFACGDKGSLGNINNVTSCPGQQLVNGERISEKFGVRRTLPYFTRFSLDPQARGFIANSFSAGLTLSEYFFSSMVTRFEFISRALATSVTGEQTRNAVKNLESAVINNFRWTMKDARVLQFAYGEDYLDPRLLERVKFPTIFMSRAAFDAKYKPADDMIAFASIAAFYDQMVVDRDTYRAIFFKVENMNINQLISDERLIPFNPDRIIASCVSVDARPMNAPTVEQMAELIRMVSDVCDNAPYLLINNIQRMRRGFVPDFVSSAVLLIQIIIRSYLNPRMFIERNIDAKSLRVILDKIQLCYMKSLVDPGAAVGVIAAQEFSAPFTQAMLDATKKSATGGTSHNKIKKLKEIMGARDGDKLSSPAMFIMVAPEHRANKARVQEFANKIDVMKLGNFAVSWHIYYEKYGAPVHPTTVHEIALIAEYTAGNPGLSPPPDLINWCIRVVLNKTTLILKNMSMELIISRMREQFPDTYIVYTPENAPQLILRVYIRNSMASLKNMATVDNISEIKDELLAMNIRGVESITNASLQKLVRNKVDDDGAIVRNDGTWAIRTSGTNLREIMTLDFVDKTTTSTDALSEMYDMLGIEAVRQKLCTELRLLIPDLNHRHYLEYADEMTMTGRVTSIERAGMRSRESSNVMLRMGFKNSIQVLEEAAVNTMKDTISGITAPLLVGSIPKFGTLYNSVAVDGEFVKKHVKSASSLLDEL